MKNRTKKKDQKEVSLGLREIAATLKCDVDYFYLIMFLF
jgi:hypothetical protein